MWKVLTFFWYLAIIAIYFVFIRFLLNIIKKAGYQEGFLAAMAVQKPNFSSDPPDES